MFVLMFGTACLSAAAGGFGSFPAKVAAGLFISYGVSVGLRFLLVRVFDAVDPRFEVTTPLITNLNKSRAHARVYSFLREKQLLSLSTNDHTDWIEGNWSHV